MAKAYTKISINDQYRADIIVDKTGKVYKCRYAPCEDVRVLVINRESDLPVNSLPKKKLTPKQAIRIIEDGE